MCSKILCFKRGKRDLPESKDEEGHFFVVQKQVGEGERSQGQIERRRKKQKQIFSLDCLPDFATQPSHHE